VVRHGREDVAFAYCGLSPSGAVQLGQVDLDTFLGGVDVGECESATGVGVACGVPNLVPVDLDEVGISLRAFDDRFEGFGGPGNSKGRAGSGQGLAGLVRLQIAHRAVLEALGVGDGSRDDVRGMGQPSGQERRRDGTVGGLQLLPGVGNRAQGISVGCLKLVDEQDQSLVVGVRSRGLGGVGHEFTERAGGFGSGPLGAGQFEVAHSWDPS
jgi:hypothetical protein